MKKSKKIKITVNIDEKTLRDLRTAAHVIGTPYQTLLNKLLRDALTAQKDEGTRLERLEREVERIKKTLSF